MQEAELVKKCLSGDQKACKELYLGYAPGLLSLCHRYFNHTAEAEDALQEGFIKVFQSLETWKGTGPLGAWIRRIVVNTYISRLQSQYYLSTQLGEEYIPEVHNDPDIFNQLQYDELEKIIKDMPVGYRTVFNLCIIEGYSYEEVSNMIQIKEGTCRSQLHKAKNYLAKRLQRIHPELKLPA